MTKLTRRSALAASGSLLVALAGCLSSDESGAQETPTTSRDDSTTTTGERPEHLEWRRDLVPTSGPLVVDETIFVGDQRGRLHAMSPDGSDRWTVDAKGPVQSIHVTPSTLYVQTGTWSGPHLDGAVVQAIEPDGSERRWAVEVGEASRWGNILGVADGVLGIGLQNDYLQGSGEATFGLAVEDGTELWRAETGDVMEGATGSDTIYAAAYDRVVAFDPKSGETRWTIAEDFADAPELLGDRPLMAADEVRAIDPESGDVRWTYGEDVDLAGATAIGDRAYTNGARIAALSADGTEAWRYETGGMISTWTEELLFGSADESRLFALSMTGEERWTTAIPDEHFTLEAATRSVVGGTLEGTVYVFDQADGSERYTFQVAADHAAGIAGTADRLVVADETGLYGLSG